MHPSISRNTLFSQASIEEILRLPGEEGLYTSISEILIKFQDIKKFASEIHTETHLIKPILKIFGYAYESKPKFFEEHVKGPDVVMFTSEEGRAKSSQLWESREYYNNALCILLLKRYGRNLQEGISGFYLEFENRIPIYQMIYLLKKTKTPWGILTNGRHWVLLKKPLHFEIRLFEIDLETSLFEGDEATIHLFYQIFSLFGLKKTIPEALEEERKGLIEVLKEKKIYIQKSIQGLRKRVDIYPKITNTYKELLPEKKLLSTEAYLEEKHIQLENKDYIRQNIMNEYNASDIFSYLFIKKAYEPALNLEEIILKERGTHYTKEDLLSLKILDMTPCFGNITTQLIDSLAYLSFVLPYKEKNTFTAEWEDELGLKKYIINNLLYGIERSHISFDILQNIMNNRFNSTASHYKLGNPLIGISLKDISSTSDVKNQMNLFNKHPKDVIMDFKEMYTLYFSLSEKIKEDLKSREEIEVNLKIYTERIRDLLDIITTTYFSKSVDNKKTQDMLFSLDSDEYTWESLRKKDWFIESKEIAKRNGFFHLEIEFPFLLNNAFDFIFVQPALHYVWEEDPPIMEETKAYIKRGMTYLKQQGTMIIISEHAEDHLLQELKKSKKYEIEIQPGMLILKK